jgi:hypothetical protein
MEFGHRFGLENGWHDVVRPATRLWRRDNRILEWAGAVRRRHIGSGRVLWTNAGVFSGS